MPDTVAVQVIVWWVAIVTLVQVMVVVVGAFVTTSEVVAELARLYVSPG